jgi:hypothetical protein
MQIVRSASRFLAVLNVVLGPAFIIPAPVSAATFVAAAHRRSLKSACDSFCSSRSGGLFANPCDSSCSTFIQCANGITYTQQCPAGLLYNPSVSVCDWPANVRCDGGNDPTDSSPPPPAKKAKPPPPAKKAKKPPPTKKAKKPPPSHRPPPTSGAREFVFLLYYKMPGW